MLRGLALKIQGSFVIEGMQGREPISRLVKSLCGLPGIGEKTASRLAHFMLNAKREYTDELVRSIIDVKENVRLCPGCLGFSAESPCPICRDRSRDSGTICVVGDFKDLVALEAAGSYRGGYHVLHGLLAPLKGIGPDGIKVRELIERVERGGVREVILATSFDAEGEGTALYLKRLLSPFEGLMVTRIASGIPVGSYIEYMDPGTLGRAMEGRKEA